jgi:hypothetical protein
MAKTLKLREDVHTDFDMKSILANFGAVKKESLQESEKQEEDYTFNNINTLEKQNILSTLDTTSNDGAINISGVEYTPTINEKNATTTINGTTTKESINNTGDKDTPANKQDININTTNISEDISTPSSIYAPTIINTPGDMNTPGSKFPPNDKSKNALSTDSSIDLNEKINTPSGEYTYSSKMENSTGVINTTILPEHINTSGRENTPTSSNLICADLNTTGSKYIPDMECENQPTGINTPIKVGNINTPSCINSTTEDSLIAQCGSITHYGYYCILRRIILENSGTVRINAFCKQYKCDKKTLLTVIKRFEEKGLLYTLSSGMDGRKFLLPGGISTPRGVNTPMSFDSSSYYLNNTKRLQLLQHLGEGTVGVLNAPGCKYTPGSINSIGFDNTTSTIQRKKDEDNNSLETKVLDSKLSIDVNTASDLRKLPSLPSWERAQVTAQAEELFYISLAAQADTGIFSMQTVTLYVRISKEHDRDYAAALFLSLLPKVKDNPTGYLLSAYKQGAEPTSDSISKVREIWKLLDSLTKSSRPRETQKQIMAAMERNDMETVTLLAQEQMQIKVALHELSWPGTVDELIEKRDIFMISLFGNSEPRRDDVRNITS